MKNLLLLAGLFAITGLINSSADAAAEPKPGQAAPLPNILMIAIDDQNDWIGYLGGHPQAQTPNIDALAARGTAFTNAHCQSPLCNPSRTSLMIGLRPGTTGIYGLKPWFREVEELKNIVTLPQYFATHGDYLTATAGKIYHGGTGRSTNPPHVEWHEIGPPASGKPFPPEKLVNTPQDHKLVDWGTFPHKDEDKSDYAIATWAVEKLQQHAADGGNQPLFLAAGFFLPHVPLYATEKWMDMYPIDSIQLPEIQEHDRADTPRFSWNIHWKLPEPRLKFLKDKDEWHNIVRSYLACTTFVDSQIGRVLKALKDNKLEENTIVVLWSDHGWHLGEKEITGKNTLWDDGTRVPLVFAGPGVSPGQICTQPAELLDIYPTLLELAGLPPNKRLEGHSLVPQLNDSNTKRKFPAITHHNHDNVGIRTENWRYIKYADGSEELYNMKKDPNEWTNLADNPEYSDQKKKLVKWVPKNDAPPAPGSAARILTYNPDTGETLWEEEPINPNDPIPEL
ncbi:MAG: sulfatase [Verrucomicrobiota bacterium]